MTDEAAEKIVVQVSVCCSLLNLALRGIEDIKAMLSTDAGLGVCGGTCAAKLVPGAAHTCGLRVLEPMFVRRR